MKMIQNYLLALALLCGGIAHAKNPRHVEPVVVGTESDTVWNPDRYAALFGKKTITFKEFLAQGGILAPGKMIGNVQPRTCAVN